MKTRLPVDEAVLLEPLLPPGEKPARRLSLSHADEARVERAAPKEVDLRRPEPVARHRLEQVRCQEDVVSFELLPRVVERREDEDVGVEVHRRPNPGAGEELVQHERLQRRAQLEGRILEREVPEARDPE